jgi:8-oxo-dGTP diphosphatase
VRALEPFALASQYFLNTDGEALNNQATFFVLALEADDPGLKVEDDHTLVWAEPASAVAQLRHDAHAWAVAAWMRRLRPGA